MENRDLSRREFIEVGIGVVGSLVIVGCVPNHKYVATELIPEESSSSEEEI